MLQSWCRGIGLLRLGGEIRTQVKLQSVQIVGEHINLFENVHSLNRIMHFAYESGILDNLEGQGLLNSLMASLNVGDGGHSVQSKTYEEARKEAEVLVRAGPSG